MLSSSAESRYPPAMLRYLSPALFFIASVVVYQHNHGESASVWVLPMMDVIWPETAGSVAAQGDKTVITLIALGAVLMVLQVAKDWRYRQLLKGHFQEPRA